MRTRPSSRDATVTGIKRPNEISCQVRMRLLPQRDATKSSLGSAWPVDLVEAVKKVISTPCDRPATPEFSFEMTAEAAQKNWCILSKYKLDNGKALEAQRLSRWDMVQSFDDPRSSKKFSTSTLGGRK